MPRAKGWNQEKSVKMHVLLTLLCPVASLILKAHKRLLSFSISTALNPALFNNQRSRLLDKCRFFQYAKINCWGQGERWNEEGETRWELDPLSDRVERVRGP